MSTILSHFIKSLVFYSVSSGETLSQNTVKTVSAEWQSCENCGEFFFYANQDIDGENCFISSTCMLQGVKVVLTKLPKEVS